MTFRIFGIDFIIELTRILNPSTLLILLNGLSSLIVLKAYTLPIPNIDRKPVTTTIKSSLFHPSFK
jgi:hypothetical protein